MRRGIEQRIHKEFIISVRLGRAPGWKEERASAVWLANHAKAVMVTKAYNYKLQYVRLFVFVCVAVCCGLEALHAYL